MDIELATIKLSPMGYCKETTITREQGGSLFISSFPLHVHTSEMFRGR